MGLRPIELISEKQEEPGLDHLNYGLNWRRLRIRLHLTVRKVRKNIEGNLYSVMTIVGHTDAQNKMQSCRCR